MFTTRHDSCKCKISVPACRTCMLDGALARAASPSGLWSGGHPAGSLGAMVVFAIFCGVLAVGYCLWHVFTQPDGPGFDFTSWLGGDDDGGSDDD